MPHEQRDVDCCVIGGGPTGLLFALALGLHGREVLVLERHERASMEVGAPNGPIRATTLQPATLAVFRSVGLLERIAAGSARLDGGQVIVDGRPVATFDYPDIPGCPVPFALSTPLSTTVAALLAALDGLPNVQFAFGADVKGLTGSSPERFGVRYASGEVSTTVEARFVIASDGRFSPTRAMAGIRSETVELAPGYFDFNLPLPDEWDRRIRVYLGEHGYLMASPRVGGELILAWITDTATADRYAAGPIDEFAALIAKAVPALAESVHEHLTSWDDVRRTRHHAVRAERWSERNLILLGDAAHGMHAFGGQGLNIAIQDVACVAHGVAAALENGGERELREFEAVRKPFVDAFQDLQRASVGDRQRAARPDPTSLPEMQTLTLGQPEIRALLEAAAAGLADRARTR